MPYSAALALVRSAVRPTTATKSTCGWAARTRACCRP